MHGVLRSKVWKASGKEHESIVALLATVVQKSSILGRSSRVPVTLGRTEGNEKVRVRVFKRTEEWSAQTFRFWSVIRPGGYRRMRGTGFRNNANIYLMRLINSGAHGAVFLAATLQTHRDNRDAKVASLFALKMAFTDSKTRRRSREETCRCSENNKTVVLKDVYDKSAETWNAVYQDAHLKAQSVTVVTGALTCSSCNEPLPQAVLAMPYLHSPAQWAESVVGEDETEAQYVWDEMVNRLIDKWKDARHIHTDVKLSNAGVWMEADKTVPPVLILFDMETFAGPVTRGEGDDVLSLPTLERTFCEFGDNEIYEWSDETALYDHWANFVRQQLPFPHP